MGAVLTDRLHPWTEWDEGRLKTQNKAMAYTIPAPQIWEACRSTFLSINDFNKDSFYDDID